MTTFSLQDQDLFRRQAYIGGRWCDSDTGATLEVNNPATGEILGTVPMSAPFGLGPSSFGGTRWYSQWGIQRINRQL